MPGEVTDWSSALIVHPRWTETAVELNSFRSTAERPWVELVSSSELCHSGIAVTENVSQDYHIDQSALEKRQWNIWS